MNRFNLTFKGEILPGRKVEQVKLRFGEMFTIDDPVRLDRFFSGQTIILRRNLDRKTAAELFQKLRKIGMVVELEKSTTADTAAAITQAPPPPEIEIADKAAGKQGARGMNQEIMQRRPGQIDQSWAVSSSATRRPSRVERDQAAADAARQESERIDRERQQAEEAAREKARREEAEHKAAEEAAKRQAEEAAREQALREEAERKAAEEAARKAAEEAARLKAEQAEKKRKAAEEAARLKAEEQRKKAEKRARLKAQRAEEAARKKALEEEARRKAAEEEARRKAAEELARRKAELAEQKRKKAQEAARLKAELAERKRKAAEEVAREQAILKEAKRKAAEDAAREQAKLDEAKRKAAAEVARLQAEQEEVSREAAAKVARLRAEQEEVAHKAAEEVARIQAEQLREEKAERRHLATLKAAEEAATRQATLEVAKQTAAAQAAREEAKKAEQAAQHAAMEEQAVQRAAVELAQQPALKPARASVKTNLELPQRTSNRGTRATTTTPRRRQPGEPNLYSLLPFRNTLEVRARAEQSQASMRVRLIAAALALASLLLLGGRFLSLPSVPAITGAAAMAIDAQARPLLLAGDNLLLHDRSGVGTGTLPLESLGLTSLQGPMAFDKAGELLALGRLKTAGAEAAEAEPLQLLRCDLTESRCRPFSAELAGNRIAGFAIHELDGTVFLADAANGQLFRASAEGTVLARAAASVPDKPIMRLESGLLFMNSALGPAVSVFRYDDSAFGQQLDEILLLPPAATAAEQSQVGDFVWSTGNWWASMYNPQSNSAGLYRFDEQWNFIEQAELPADTWPQQLATWGDKTLVRDEHHVPIQRFNAGGAPEAPLVSELLDTLVEHQQRNASLAGMAWRISLILCALVAIAGLCLGSLARLRVLVYKPHRERGTDPVDEYVDAVHWLDPIPGRSAQLRRTAISYALVAVALLLLAIAQRAAPIQLAAVLIALCGPAIALLLLGRSSVGHIGILQERLLLVDHTGMYHLGGGPRVQYRGSFLLIDDVVVFTGSRLLPAFSSKQVAGGVAPLTEAGIKVDRKTVIIKLLQAKHPLAQGAVAVLVAFTMAALLLCLQGIF